MPSSSGPAKCYIVGIDRIERIGRKIYRVSNATHTFIHNLGGNGFTGPSAGDRDKMTAVRVIIRISSHKSVRESNDRNFGSIDDPTTRCESLRIIVGNISLTVFEYTGNGREFSVRWEGGLRTPFHHLGFISQEISPLKVCFLRMTMVGS